MILAALELALGKRETLWIWIVYVVAWAAMALYLLTSALYAVSRLAENIEWSTKYREIYVWLTALLSLAISISITYILPALTAEFIRLNFSGSP